MTIKLLVGFVSSVALALFAGLLPASAQVACVPAPSGPAYQNSSYAPAYPVQTQPVGYYGMQPQMAMPVGYYSTSNPLADLVYGIGSAYFGASQYAQYPQYSGYPYYASYPNYSGYTNYAGYPNYQRYNGQRRFYFNNNVRRVISDRRHWFAARNDRDDRRNMGPIRRMHPDNRNVQHSRTRFHANVRSNVQETRGRPLQ